MAVRNYTNAPGSTLSSGILAAAGTLSVVSASWVPAVPFIIVVDRATAFEEVMLVTNVASTTLTVTRGYDSTIAFDHASAATVEPGVAAIDLREANAHINAANNVHGVATNVVGAADAQTLTNKTINADSNNLTGFAADQSVTADGTGKVGQTGLAVPAGGLAGLDAVATVAAKPGDVKMTAATSIEDGWLLCNGQAVSRTTYATLFSAISTRFGVGDGATTFNVPNLVDRFPRGISGNPATGGGSSLITEANLPSHDHAIGGSTGSTSVNHTHEIPHHGHNIDYASDTNVSLGGSFTRVYDVGGGGKNAVSGGINSGSDRTTSSAGGSHNHSLPANTGVAGGGTNYWQPYTSLRFIIRAV